jgi:DNA-binding TFAR19-related protein (PDSD5 family)
MIPMGDRELEALKQKRLQELQKKMSFREQKKEPSDANATLNRIFEGRAWEVFNAARAQFPSEMAKLEHLLVRLALEGKITKVDGEQLYALLRELGLRVRLNTTITVTSHGKTKLLSEKFKETAK